MHSTSQGLLVCLESREENKPFSGQQHPAQFGLNSSLPAPHNLQF